jgi:pyruvate kinase
MIIATLSDTMTSDDYITDLFSAGADVFRLNTMYQTIDSSIKLIERIRTISKISIMIDTKGNENGDTLTEKDKRYLQLSCVMGIDYIAHSFVRNMKDVVTVRELMDPSTKLVSKIENMSGVRNLEEIAHYSDMIMIARGDLGDNVGICNLPSIQKEIAEKCRKGGKEFIVATELLTSMIINPGPTRAEANDIYNCLLDGATGLLLSNETTEGKHGVKCVKFLKDMMEKKKNAL